MKTYSSNSSHKCIIEHFADGDTVLAAIKCSCCGKWDTKYVRIKGIDSWEEASPDKGKVQMIKQEATSLYADIVAELIITQQSSDKYGRVIGDIILNGQSLAGLMVEHKWAWWKTN